MTDPENPWHQPATKLDADLILDQLTAINQACEAGAQETRSARLEMMNTVFYRLDFHAGTLTVLAGLNLILLALILWRVW